MVDTSIDASLSLSQTPSSPALSLDCDYALSSQAALEIRHLRTRILKQQEVADQQEQVLTSGQMKSAIPLVEISSEAGKPGSAGLEETRQAVCAICRQLFLACRLTWGTRCVRVLILVCVLPCSLSRVVVNVTLVACSLRVLAACPRLRAWRMGWSGALFVIGSVTLEKHSAKIASICATLMLRQEMRGRQQHWQLTCAPCRAHQQVCGGVQGLGFRLAELINSLRRGVSWSRAWC
jgi:hypothetical protein